MHSDVYARYRGSGPIQWHPQPMESPAEDSLNPKIQIGLSVKRSIAVVSNEDGSARKRITKVKPSPNSDIREFKLGEDKPRSAQTIQPDEILDSGYTSELMNHVFQLNTQAKELNIQLPVQDLTQGTDPIQWRGPSKDAQCPYNIEITSHTSQYQKVKLAAKKVLRPSTRCYLCCKAAGRLAWLKVLEREKDGVPLCTASRKCENPRALGRKRCQACTDASLVQDLKKELGKKLCEGNHKGSPGSDVIDQLSMSEYLKRLKIEPFLMPGWRRFLDAVINKPFDVFVVDTETGFSGIVHEVGIARYDGTPIVDARVDREMLLTDFYKLSQAGLSESAAFRAFCAINKSPKACQVKCHIASMLCVYIIRLVRFWHCLSWLSV